jgi:uncharacterized protein (TIGR02246 family)
VRNKLFVASLLAAVVGSAPRGNAQVAPAGKAGSVQRAIEEVWARVIDADKRGDAVALAANYTEDAMLIDPSAPTITGRANIEKFYKNVLATMKLLEVSRTQTSLEVSGNLAVENGTYTHRVQQAGKPPLESTDRYTVVFKNVNGRWLVSRDIATPMPEAAR